ncbi:glyoxalase [Rhizobium rhizosphaerae]|uniref:Glyoxalase n=1 Tax=Xaviernesmea rhizosphaerae TaxID=1672749 RepID=A0A1Q9ACA6_9HYPH|nr:VOC family protein [Xaviernesmea rhizosphaerae]OLP52517.1 glyoxalase [Xaviernesmea rhizosphaerae]
MTIPSNGLHHVTLITRRIQANVDFYVGFLGLRLVKRTAGFEDAAQLHLFYGDRTGRPGSLITFLAWEDGGQGRLGRGAPSEIALAIAPEAIGAWMTRALRFQIPFTGPESEFGEPVLRLKDPDGVIVKLTGTQALSDRNAPWSQPIDEEDPVGALPPVADADAVQGLRAATILTERPEETAAFFNRHFGLVELAREGSVRRLAFPRGDAIDIRDAAGFWEAAPGTGTIDHIALRAADNRAVAALRLALAAEEAGPTPVHDRRYFTSLYVREPGESLVEFATDAPGMTVDEPEATLGTRLFVPGHEDRIPPLETTVVLPQFALPGEPRRIARDLPFIHRLQAPEEEDGTTLFLLHGSGANELSLLPLGRKAAPGALLIALRGRALEEGSPRFYRRITPFRFDQADVRAEADAFAAFITDSVAAYGVDLDHAAFLGYSNGANMIAATLFLHPGLIRRAVLLRAMNPLEEPPAADLAGTSVLMLSGSDDAYAAHAPALEEALRASGAEVEARRIAAGHLLTEEDTRQAGLWLAGKSPRLGSESESRSSEDVGAKTIG